MNRPGHRRRVVAAASAAALGLLVSVLGVVPAQAEPATDGWHPGFCKQGEGLTVVVDFGIGAERDPEARCRVGGTYSGTGERRLDVLEAVGYEVGMTGDFVGFVDGIGHDVPGVGPWWRFTTVSGEGAWSEDRGFAVPNNAMNWFQGVCLSMEGCVPRLVARFAPGGSGPVAPSVPGEPTKPPAPVEPARSAVRLKVVKLPTSTRPGVARVTVGRAAGRPSPSGRVVVTLIKAKQAKRMRTVLPSRRSAARIRLPRLAKGRWRAAVVYHGDANYQRAKAQTRLRVRR